MKAVDRWLQSWRIAKARRYIARGARVLDVGCAHGALFRQLCDRVGEGVGLDPDLQKPIEGPGYRLIPGHFPEAVLGEPPFDVITMLAVLEHVSAAEQPKMARGCAELLTPGGHLVITTPSPWVDRILRVLAAIRVIDGMSLDQHYGFEPADTPGIFEGQGLTLVAAKRFQMGLNHLFVFRKGSAAKNAKSPISLPRAVRSRRRLLLILGSVWLFSCSTGPKSQENDIVVLVSIDTLRADALGCYGNQRRPTPNLDRLASRAVRFSNAVAPSPWTIPSHASLLTSLHPVVVGATVQQPIPECVTTIAEHLADHGFATGAIVNCLYLDRKFRFDQGFQEFVFMKSPKDVNENVDAALDFLNRHDGDSVFLFLHIFDVHSPYAPPSPYDRLYAGEGGGKPDQDVDFLRKIHYHDHLTHLSETPSVDYLRRKYDAGVARVDAELGRLFQGLKERQLYDDALIIVTSDHGEAFFEHEIWVGHGLFLYSNELGIPMLAKFPKAKGPSGVVVHTPVSLVDVVPTMTDVLDLPAVAGAQGRSLRAIALDQRGGAGRDPEVPVFGSSSNTGNTQFIQTRRWKYIEPMVDDLSLVLRHHLRPSPEAATLLRERIVVGPQLFDLRNDPEERVNLARVLPKVAGRLQERLSQEKERNLQHRIALAVEQRQPDVELSEEDRQKLRSLGYAQ